LENQRAKFDENSSPEGTVWGVWQASNRVSQSQWTVEILHRRPWMRLSVTTPRCLKNATNLASSSFDEHGLILILIGKRHQHTFKNYTRVQLSLSLHFYLVICLKIAATEMTHSGITLCSWNSPAPLAENTGLYLSRSVSAKQSGWLQNLWTDAGTCVHCTITSPRYQPLWPATWSSTSLTHWQAHHKTSSTKQLVNAVSSYVQTWGERAPLWTSAKTSTFQSRQSTHYTSGSFQSHQQSTEENTLFRVISIAAI